MEVNKEKMQEVAMQGISYVQKKGEVKKLNGEIGVLRSSLEPFAEEHGERQSSGATLTSIPYADVVVLLKRTLRNSNVLVPEAVEILKKEGLRECVERVETVREDKLDILYQQGKISDELVKKLYKVVPSYAFSVSVKKKYHEEDIE